jgi:hypothetical protein
MQQAIVSEMKRFYSLKRALTAYRKNRSWRVKYRLGGNYLIRRWIKENAQYMDNLNPSSTVIGIFSGFRRANLPNILGAAL